MANTIKTLSDLGTVSAITEDQINAILARLDIKIFNALHDGGDQAAIDISLPGEAGVTVNYSASLRAFMSLRESYAKLLASPELRGDYALGMSQLLPLESTTNESDLPIRFA